MQGWEDVSSTFDRDLERLGARWYIYGQLDRQIHRGASSMMGEEYTSVITDIESFALGFPVIFSLRRGASVPYPRQPPTIYESDVGPEGKIRQELYFRPEPNWVPEPTDLIFDVMWEHTTPKGVGAGRFVKVLNVMRVGWAQARWGREDRIGYWNIMAYDVDFDERRLSADLKRRAVTPDAQWFEPPPYSRPV